MHFLNLFQKGSVKQFSAPFYELMTSEIVALFTYKMGYGFVKIRKKYTIHILYPLVRRG